MFVSLFAKFQRLFFSYAMKHSENVFAVCNDFKEKNKKRKRYFGRIDKKKLVYLHPYINYCILSDPQLMPKAPVSFFWERSSIRHRTKSVLCTQ